MNLPRSDASSFGTSPHGIDELLWDVPEDAVDDVMPLIHEAMERDDLRVPLPIETPARVGGALAH